MKKIQCKIRFLAILLLSFISGFSSAQTTEIYVRLNSDPFISPHYIFSSTINGEPQTLELVKGSRYVFIRTDGGHPFNIGSGWRESNAQIITNLVLELVKEEGATLIIATHDMALAERLDAKLNLELR